MYVCKCVHVCVYMCMRICMYMYIYVSVYMYAYTCIYTHVWVYICTRAGAFVYLYFPIPVLHTCVSQVFFQHQHACVVGDWKWGFFPNCSWLARAAGVGGYVLTEVKIEVLSCLFLYFCGCQGGGWVCAFIRAYTHTNNLGTWCEPRCRTDTWRAGRIQID